MSKHFASLQFLWLLFSLSAYSKEILVSAERVKRNYFESISSIKVFDEEDIASSQAQTIVDLLKRVAGLQVYTNGAFGKASSLFFRGTDNRHALVLVDGVEIGDPTSIHGATRLEFLSLQDIERVEILKGSQGVLYGSQAIGGVIKITTKRGKKKKSAILKIGYGSFDNKKIGFTASGAKKDLDYSFSGDYQDVDGISAYPARKALNADRDSYSNSTLTAKLRYSFQSKKRLTIGSRLLKARFDYDESDGDNKQNHALYLSQSYFLSYKDSYGKLFNPEMKYSIMEVKRDLYGNNSFGNFHFPYIGRENSLEIFNKAFYGKKNHFLLGLKHQKDKAKAFGSYLASSVENEINSIYINHYAIFEPFFADQGVRLDHLKFFGDEWTYKLGMGIHFNQTTFKTSYSTGLKAPSLFTTYSSFGGNKNLKPESSQNLELGILQGVPEGRIELTYFQIEYERYIDYINNQYINSGSFQVRGVELETEGRLGQSLLIQIHTTFLRAKNKRTGESLLRRPRWKGGSTLDYFVSDAYQVGLDLEFVGSRSDQGGIWLPSYYTLGLRGTSHLDRESRLQFKVGNLMNRKYEEITNYDVPGRSFQVQYIMRL